MANRSYRKMWNRQLESVGVQPKARWVQCPRRRGGSYWKDMKVPMVLMVFIAAFFSLPWCMRWAHNRRKERTAHLLIILYVHTHTHIYIYTYHIFPWLYYPFQKNAAFGSSMLFHLSKAFRDWLTKKRRMLPLHAVLSSWSAWLHWLLDARLLLPALIATTSSWRPAGENESRDQLTNGEDSPGQPTKQQMRAAFGFSRGQCHWTVLGLQGASWSILKWCKYV